MNLYVSNPQMINVWAEIPGNAERFFTDCNPIGYIDAELLKDIFIILFMKKKLVRMIAFYEISGN